MVLKKVYAKFEDTIFIEAESLWMEHVLSQIGQDSFKRLRNLPNELLDEMRSFIKRNSLAIVAYRIESRKPLHYCCSKCLKAHLFKKCQDLGLENYQNAISKIFECEAGHEGYYLDNKKLIGI
ncbi:MAG: hypothetical protein KJ718_01915 [Nanoarchaeota archaeon]|nr:hypothetical protein [Nanoarchaeota archaeon]